MFIDISHRINKFLLFLFIIFSTLPAGVISKHYLGVESPKIAILTNGTESIKGTEVIQETRQLLEKLPSQFRISNLEFRINLEFSNFLISELLDHLDICLLEIHSKFEIQNSKLVTTPNPNKLNV